MSVQGRTVPWETAFEPDPVVEAYKRHVDRTLLRQNLRRAVTERVANLIALPRLAAEARRTGRAPGVGSMTDFETVIRIFSDAGIEA